MPLGSNKACQGEAADAYLSASFSLAKALGPGGRPPHRTSACTHTRETASYPHAFTPTRAPTHPHHHTSPSLLFSQAEAAVKKLAERMPDIGRKMEYLLNTGAGGEGGLTRVG